MANNTVVKVQLRLMGQLLPVSGVPREPEKHTACFNSWCMYCDLQRVPIWQSHVGLQSTF